MDNIANTHGMGDNKDSDVTIDMLDYKFINECNNIKMLEKILKTLKSGRDGYYPHLVKHCEEKVAQLNPKSRYLRSENKILKSRDLSSDEADQLVNGMGEFIHNMKESETVKTANGFPEKELPPVRANVNLGKSSENHQKKTDKIKGSDFRAWDKYDAEEECKKVDDPEFVSTKKKKITIPHTIDSSKMNESEKQLKADKEKDKGNEAFKSGDYDEALAYYSRSMSLNRTAASINNRALTYLRLERWKDALKDCNEVLDLEMDNIKAKLRRATALKELGKYEDAKTDLEFVLEVEPNNARAKKIMQEIEPKVVKKGRKMKILEVEEDEEESVMVNGSPASESLVEEKVSEEKQKPAVDDNFDLPNTSSSKNASDDAINKDTKDKKSDKAQQQNIEEILNQPAVDETNPGKAEEQIMSEEDVKEKSEPPPPVEIIHTPLPAELEGVKTEAGNLYRTGQYGAAADKYTRAITRLSAKAEKNPDANYSHALATLYNNRAACKLKSGDDKSCIADCEQVLGFKPSDIKALLRRAAAYEHMEKYRLAYDDYRAIQSMDWTVSQAQEGANRVAKHMRDVYGSKWRDMKKEIPPSNLPAKSSSATNVNKVEKNTTSKKVENSKPSAPKTYESSRKNKTPKTDKVSPAQKPKPKMQTPVDSPPVTGKQTSASSTKTSSKSQTVKDKRRAKLSQELFAKLKAEGNNFVKKGNYAKAIESYTQCIKICPQEIASYTNRALCFLKLNKEISAVGDCTEAIKLDSRSIKAYYRRAQANKNLKLYREAEKDLTKVLEIEPNNKSAVGELVDVRKLLQSSTKRKVPITEVSDDENTSESDDLNEKDEQKADEHATTTKTSVMAEGVSLDSDVASKTSELLKTVKISSTDAEKISPNTMAPTKDDLLDKSEKDVNLNTSSTKSSQPVAPDSASTETVPLTEGEATSKTKHSKSTNTQKVTSKQPSPQGNEKTATKVPNFRLQIPENLTPYEFGNLWNSIQPKTNVEAYKCILDNVPSERVPVMVSNKTNDHMIVTFAKIARIHMLSGTAAEYYRAYDILFQLTKAERFQMAAMFLSKADKAVVESAFAELKGRVKTPALAFSVSNLQNLKKAYML